MSEENTDEDVSNVDANAKKPVKKPAKETSDEAIVRAEAAATRLEAGNVKLAALLEKQESLKVEETLGGEADAGAQKKSVEEVQADTAKAYLEGTGLAEEAFPEKKV